MSSLTITEDGPVHALDFNSDTVVSIQPKHKDFLGRTLSIGDRVVMIKANYKEFQLAQVVAFTPKKVKVAWGDSRWDNLTTDGYRFVKVEGPDLTWFLLSRGLK